MHQNRICLQGSHASCPVYQTGWQGPLPQRLEGQTSRRSASPSLGWILLGSFIAVGLILVSSWRVASGSLWFSNAAGESRPALQPAGKPAAASEEDGGKGAAGDPLPPLEVQLAGIPPGIEADQPALGLTATPFLVAPEPAAPTVSPASSSGFPTPGPLPGTPFAGAQTFLIYRVLPGETLASIGSRYQTDLETLRAINPGAGGQVLQPGELIVVAVGLTDSADLPAFEIVYLTRGQTQASIASTHGISVDTLRIYNGLGADTWVPAGRWLVIPDPR